MKKLSLLLALALFGFGSATMVNAEMGETPETDTTEQSSEGTSEEVVLDENGQPIIPVEETDETATDAEN